MGISKGQPWEQAIPDDCVLRAVADDAAAAAAVQQSSGDGGLPPTLQVQHGDVVRSLGGAGMEGLRCPMDAIGIAVTAKGATSHFVGVAHLVVRAPLWHGDAAVVMNVSHLGDLNLGPRAHPGDGRLDLTEGRLRLLERLQARQRARLGTHVPHPDLRTRRVTEAALEVGRSARVFVDGVAVARGPAHVAVSVMPDAWWWAGSLPR